ncbi:MAG: SPFH domain-containing protein [Oscillospiraceae bacterium]|nr:SPFH domain-containing protein [Oscillospiraceae bacterium]
MGLIKAAMGAAGGVLADQWLEFFYCEALPVDILVTKGQKRVSGRSSNTKGEENIISNGSGIAVADGQCMIIVEQGKILDYCAEPGQYTFQTGGEPSLFAGGGLGENALNSLKNVWERFKYGGSPGRDTRVYYFNMKEIIGNKYGTPSPVPFRVVEPKTGLDLDAEIRCSGTYSYKICNPMLFYTNICGNVAVSYKREQIDEQIKGEVISNLRPMLAKISAKGIRYSELPEHEGDLLAAMNEEMREKWGGHYGIEMTKFTMPNAQIPDKYMDMIRDAQQRAILLNPNMAAATLVGAQAEAMKSAAKNEGGSAMAFMGMNMANQAGGMNAQSLYQMGQQQEQQQQAAAPQQTAAAPAAAGWTCVCGNAGNTGKFCSECGKPQPQDESWTCECGAVNKGKFCAECGKPKPQETGWTCSCGAVNEGKFCSECGGSRP